MKMEWPQIVWCVLTLGSLAIHAAQNGKPSTYHFPVRLVAALVMFWLLWCGGFFGGVP